MIGRTAARSARPDHVAVAFGLKFSAQGDVIVAKASAEASLTVALTYDTRSAAQNPPAAAPSSGAEVGAGAGAGRGRGGGWRGRGWGGVLREAGGAQRCGGRRGVR